MRIHDWTRVDAGVFHDFHLTWIGLLKSALNSGLLPADYYALAEQIAGGLGPGSPKYPWWIVAVRHVSHHRMIALVEMASPTTKTNRLSFRTVIDKAQSALAQGVHLLLIDLPLPEPGYVQGIHETLWEEVSGDAAEPLDKPTTLAAYAAGPTVRAYVEPLAVGDELPDMPLFLTSDQYINVPLESTYRAAYEGVPRYYRTILETRKEP